MTIARTAALLLLAAATAGAEPVRRFDGYEVHYNAFRADFLPESISTKHGLTRAADRGLVNVTILRARSDATFEAIEAVVTATVSREGAPASAIRLRPVSEPGSVSYMGSFQLEGERPYRFDVVVQPFGAAKAESIRFRQSVPAQ